MGLFANLLPGIRDLRVPLAAGTVWLAAIVIALSTWIAPPFDPASLIGQVVTVGRWAGLAGCAAALAFLAYVTGIVLEKLSLPVPTFAVRGAHQASRPLAPYIRESLDLARSRGISPRAVVNELPFLRASEAERYSDDELEQYALEAQAEDGRSGEPLQTYVDRDLWNWLGEDGQIAFILREMRSNLSQAEFSFLISNPQVYDLYDRKRAEADFRRAMPLPMVFLGLALAIRVVGETTWWGALFALLIVPAALLARSGALLEVEADGLLEEAIRAGLVPASEPQRIRALNKPQPTS
jgi:hypothetical protein